MEKTKRESKKPKYTTFGLSFPDERVLDAARIKASELGMSLSAYVNHLIRKDVGMPGAFTHIEQHGGQGNIGQASAPVRQTFVKKK